MLVTSLLCESPEPEHGGREQEDGHRMGWAREWGFFTQEQEFEVYKRSICISG